LGPHAHSHCDLARAAHARVQVAEGQARERESEGYINIPETDLVSGPFSKKSCSPISQCIFLKRYHQPTARYSNEGARYG
jgi:hypothetical protein